MALIGLIRLSYVLILISLKPGYSNCHCHYSGHAGNLAFPQAAPYLSLLGDLFIKALKSVAPILVFVLVMASIANFKLGQTAHIKPILMMYMVGMLLAAFSAVFASLMFPSTLFLDVPSQLEVQAPGDWEKY